MDIYHGVRNDFQILNKGENEKTTKIGDQFYFDLKSKYTYLFTFE
jgi:hypothetical protein